MERQRVIIPNNKNEKLVGHLYKGSSQTIIIVCHGIESTNNPVDPKFHKIVPDYFSRLSSQTDASIFSFDFSGFGESEGNFTYSLKQRDLETEAVINYFVHDYKNIILYGFSWGAISTSIAAIKHKKVSGLITVNGFFTYKPTEIYLSNIFIFYFYALTHKNSWSELFFLWKNLQVAAIKVPTLVIYSDKDNYVHPKQSRNFYSELITKKKIVALKSNDHAMAKEYLQLPPTIATWFNEIFEK